VTDRGALKVDEATGPRWSLALELLAQGETVIFDGISLTVTPETLLVLVQTTWEMSRVTPENAREDIARGERVVSALLGSSEQFKRLVGVRAIEYHAIDDYGMGAGWLAELRDGEFRWTGLDIT